MAKTYGSKPFLRTPPANESLRYGYSSILRTIALLRLLMVTTTPSRDSHRTISRRINEKYLSQRPKEYKLPDKICLRSLPTSVRESPASPLFYSLSAPSLKPFSGEEMSRREVAKYRASAVRCIIRMMNARNRRRVRRARCSLFVGLRPSMSKRRNHCNHLRNVSEMK